MIQWQLKKLTSIVIQVNRKMMILHGGVLVKVFEELSFNQFFFFTEVMIAMVAK